jgi:DNA-binding FrmR family transcriptional regulator
MTEPHIHETHPEIIKRLRRAEGHLRKVIGMFDDGRSCQELSQQLHAIEKAIGAAKKTLIHDHIEHCLGHSAEDGNDGGSAIAELKELTKYL